LAATAPHDIIRGELREREGLLIVELDCERELLPVRTRPLAVSPSDTLPEICATLPATCRHETSPLKRETPIGDADPASLERGPKGAMG